MYKLQLFLLTLLYSIYNPIRAWFVRRKKHITVAFVIDNIAKWKTERLYLAMLEHERFTPLLLVRSAHDEVCPVLEKKGYNYKRITDKDSIWKLFNPDITFYQEPYGVGLIHNPFSLFCRTNYGLFLENDFGLHNPYTNVCWRYYLINKDELSIAQKALINKGKCCKLTGTPILDEFGEMASLSSRNSNRKRIIWAPHHTIPNFETGWAYSTFLTYCEFMKSLVEKYRDIDFIFKPHPVLYSKLCCFWGKKDTDSYYDWWRSQPNTQISEGQYIDLFFSSDAIIHDCVSFINEWMFTKKPGLFLLREDGRDDGQSIITQKTLNTYYKAQTAADIESFIEEVIVNGKDFLRDCRLEIYQTYYSMVSDKSCCNRIIEDILGE